MYFYFCHLLSSNQYFYRAVNVKIGDVWVYRSLLQLTKEHKQRTTTISTKTTSDDDLHI